MPFFSLFVAQPVQRRQDKVKEASQSNPVAYNNITHTEMTASNALSEMLTIIPQVLSNILFQIAKCFR
jgi:hypothetical protein